VAVAVAVAVVVVVVVVAVVEAVVAVVVDVAAMTVVAAVAVVVAAMMVVVVVHSIDFVVNQLLHLLDSSYHHHPVQSQLQVLAALDEKQQDRRFQTQVHSLALAGERWYTQ
jgi:hypothetical protein